MPKSYADLLKEARSQIKEVSPPEADLIRERGATTFVDVREASEWEQGHLPGAVHISKSYIEQQIEGALPDRDAPVVTYCAGGVRSLFAAQTLQEMGYTNVSSMSGGFQQWKSQGLPWTVPTILSSEQKQRYSRHLLIPEVGTEGQTTLLGSKALLIGAGGLGSPAALYLAAAGVGTIGVVDFDVVDLSNLQRQVIHTTDRVGEKKTESARRTINALNPDVNVVLHEEMLTDENALLKEDLAFFQTLMTTSGESAAGISINRSISTPGLINCRVHGFAHTARKIIMTWRRFWKTIRTSTARSISHHLSSAARACAGLLRRRRPGRGARDHGPAADQRGDQDPAADR